MNYLKMKVLISLLILIESCLCCQVTTDRPIEELTEENKKSPWIVVIIDLTKQRDFTLGFNSQCYGSFIHPKLVLSTNYPLLNAKPDDLEVIANMTVVSKKDVKYDMRKVIFTTAAWAIKEKEKSVNDWVMLLLERPYELSDRINVINLAGSGDKVDENCKIYHWQVVTSSYTDQFYDNKYAISTGIVNYPYNVTLNKEKFKLTEEGIVKMGGDLDCIVEQCVEENWSAEETIRKLSFFGTPIVCPLEDGTPVQVGFSTMVYEIHGKNDGVVKYYSGDFIRFLNDKEKYLDFLIDIYTGKNQ
ncbi:GSCOCG00007318001-RA-CDS [Cotesia congregata]|nr:GSCOCG00007318001-RA-CDS [Cotesia congregata]